MKRQGMKPEPLKGKLEAITKKNLWTVPGYSEESVKSAVEWLKEEIVKEFDKNLVTTRVGAEKLLNNIIDQSFEDVVEKEAKQE